MLTSFVKLSNVMHEEGMYLSNKPCTRVANTIFLHLVQRFLVHRNTSCVCVLLIQEPSELASL